MHVLILRIDEHGITTSNPPRSTATESRQLRVAVDGRALLQGALANPVKVDEDTGLDWELVGGMASGARRAVRIALQKVMKERKGGFCLVHPLDFQQPCMDVGIAMFDPSTQLC